ncbi:oligopeptide/dipeptide ABC transporter ATP-binding protein [Actinophytocola sp.]|uniref:oligopeptide/dipeptide ABC transporter ATP-binding protein n=1 Tax=Actinophytocola sp. TaxID=1872138 RepID=UPI003D6B4C7C
MKPHVAADSSEVIVDAEEVTKVFGKTTGRLGRGKAGVRVLRGVDLRITAGEAVGLVGESGSGKSTIARLLVALHAPSGGRLSVAGMDLTRPRRSVVRALRKHVQMVFQDPSQSLNPRLRVRTLVEEPLRVQGIESRSGRVAELLEAVGLPTTFGSRFPAELSGGQLQRVAIARALAPTPDLVVLDEAVSALDTSVQAQILNLISDLQSSTGAAFLFIGHDLGAVRHVTDRVAVLYLGRIVEVGPSDAVLASPRHPYTRALAASVLDVGRTAEGLPAPIEGEIPSIKNPPSGCGFRTRCPLATSVCAEAEPPLVALGPDWHMFCHHPDPR